ncbi:MAG: hypothetical protein JNL82_29840 [Myxococcales bacterium]|nr:hypothetical protein [Myxococcales bacterium]
MTNERRGTDNPPRYPVVTDRGLIKLVMVAPGISGALYKHNNTIKVSDEHEAAGWVLLEQLYKDEGRLDLWKIWQEYQQARALGHDADPLPDEYLPEEVRRRRAGQRPGRKKWSLPPLPASVEARTRLDDPEVVEERRGRRREPQG